MSLFTHLRSDTRRDAWSDAIAGALTAAVLIPQALAFAALAGLPPQAGLYASVLPPLAYALLVDVAVPANKRAGESHAA